MISPTVFEYPYTINSNALHTVYDGSVLSSKSLSNPIVFDVNLLEGSFVPTVLVFELLRLYKPDPTCYRFNLAINSHSEYFPIECKSEGEAVVKKFFSIYKRKVNLVTPSHVYTCIGNSILLENNNILFMVGAVLKEIEHVLCVTELKVFVSDEVLLRNDATCKIIKNKVIPHYLNFTRTDYLVNKLTRHMLNNLSDGRIHIEISRLKNHIAKVTVPVVNNLDSSIHEYFRNIDGELDENNRQEGTN